MSRKLNFPQNPQGLPCLPTAMACNENSPCNEGFSRQASRGDNASQYRDAPQAMPDVVLYDKLDILVAFLLPKYQKKEKMVHTVDHDC